MSITTRFEGDGESNGRRQDKGGSRATGRACPAPSGHNGARLEHTARISTGRRRGASGGTRNRAPTPRVTALEDKARCEWGVEVGVLVSLCQPRRRSESAPVPRCTPANREGARYRACEWTGRAPLRRRRSSQVGVCSMSGGWKGAAVSVPHHHEVVVGSRALLRPPRNVAVRGRPPHRRPGHSVLQPLLFLFLTLSARALFSTIIKPPAPSCLSPCGSSDTKHDRVRSNIAVGPTVHAMPPPRPLSTIKCMTRLLVAAITL